MKIFAHRSLILLLAIFCSCEKWFKNPNSKSLICLKSLIDVTDWEVPKFLLISQQSFETRAEFYERNENFTWQINNFEKRDDNSTEYFNVIIFAQNFADLKEILNTSFDIRRIDGRAKFAISLTEEFSNLDEIREASRDIPELFWKLDRTRVTFLVICKENIHAMTYFPFADNCKPGELEILNTCNGSEFEKEVELFPEKMTDIRGCVQNYIRGVKPQDKNNETGDLLLAIIAEKMNVKLQRIIIIQQLAAECYDNMVREGQAILVIMRDVPDNYGEKYYDQNIGYMEIWFAFGYLTKGFNEISWKNFVRPLSGDMWLYVGTTGLAFVVFILMTNFCHWSKILYDKIGVFDAYAIFLGAGRVLPSSNFGRYVAGIWIIYCFLINATYNSRLISYLTTPIQERLINTHEDLLNSGIDFGGHSLHRRMYGGTNSLKRVQDNFKIWSPAEARNRLLNGDTAVGFIINNGYVYDRYDMGNYSNRLHILKERTVAIQARILIRKGSPFVIGMQRYTKRAIESGLHDYWIANYGRMPRSKPIPNDPPVVITMEHVTGILYVYIFAVIFCCAIFLAEVIVSRRGGGGERIGEF